MAEIDLLALEEEVTRALTALEPPAAETKMLPAQSGLSFSASEAAESEALTRLRALAQEARLAPAEAVSFGVDETPSPLQQAEAEFSTFLENLANELRFLAAIQSRQNGRVFAQTKMTWDGDTLTALAADLAPLQAQQHLQALSVHLKRKLLALRMITLLLAMLTRVTLFTGLSGPLAWLTAYRQLKEVSALWREAVKIFL